MSKSLKGLILLLTAALAGCAGALTSADGQRMRLRSDEFAAYAERVFRLQNAVLDELAFALDQQPDDSRLVAAEDRVFAACAGINDIAVRRARGARTRSLRAARAARRIPQCEAAADAAAAMLAALPASVRESQDR